MALDLTAAGCTERAAQRPWDHHESYWGAFTRATHDRSAPVVAVNVDALLHNAQELVRRAGGLPVRVASKSVRVRGVLDAVLKLPGFGGVLAYTLAEAIWLSDTVDDVVVGYPTVDRAALAQLLSNQQALERVTLMIDDPQQLDLVEAVRKGMGATAVTAPVQVCLDIDASWRTPVLGHIGVRRSPVRTAAQAKQLALNVARRDGFKLAGLMAYEAQIAGVGDKAGGNLAESAMLRAMQRASAAELAVRRAEVVAAVREVADLRFVNGGGTGSVERTASEGAVTEVAAGSGLYGPHLFDDYLAFENVPAVGFALDVVRKPTPDRATLLGGGWIASGPASPDRLPLPVWPEQLTFERREGAGEVQTPVVGRAARDLTPGDRVWLRHTKAGEVMEHTTELIPVTSDGAALAPLATYRGEGKCFL